MERLQQWLAASNTSQRAFAEQMGVTQAAVSLWVQGKSVPTGERLRKLVQTTGLSFDDLLGDHRSPKKKRAS
jgi:transcriptional regulator with XRE-family HTH domain